jgi:protein-tyrosine kinase
MTNPRLSLVERAAEIYDFASRQPIARPVDELPPRRLRAAPVADTPEPLTEGPRVQASAQPQAAVRPRPSARSVRHARVEIDRTRLTEAGCLVPDASPAGLEEEMRLVKRRLLAAIDARPAGKERGRIALIASPQPGDGKTFVALNLALSIAGEQDRSVLLVDGDSSKADLAARLDIEEGPGLIDALVDRSIDVEELVLETDIDRLYVLPAGRKERNAPELLASGRTQDVLDRLLAADPSRIILIDSPPALAASSAAVLASYAGHGLVVVRADGTSEADLKEALSLLSPCPNLSLVLNGTAFRIGGRRLGKYEEYP